MAVINTNTLSLINQNNLSKSQTALGSSIERLSSGLRINSAKDDAAGQAIANRFTSNINGMGVAARQRRHFAGANGGRRTERNQQQPATHPGFDRPVAQNSSNSASDIDSYPGRK